MHPPIRKTIDCAFNIKSIARDNSAKANWKINFNVANVKENNSFPIFPKISDILNLILVRINLFNFYNT